MATIGQSFTAGEWLVKEGKARDFIQAWAGFAAWCYRNGWGAEPPSLLQDAAQPRRFVSFGAWDDADQVRAWRELPEFKQFLARAQELCEEIRPGTFTLAARPGG